MLSFIRWKEEVELFIRRIYVDEAKEKYMVEINNSRGVAKPTRFMGAYDEVVLAGCFSTDVKAVVVIVIVATTARHSTTKRRAVNDNMEKEGKRFRVGVVFNKRTRASPGSDSV